MCYAGIYVPLNSLDYSRVPRAQVVYMQHTPSTGERRHTRNDSTNLSSIFAPTTTAPAIVISSLGGLVFGNESLTPKDAYRACMLRKALKKQLGRPR